MNTVTWFMSRVLGAMLIALGIAAAAEAQSVVDRATKTEPAAATLRLPARLFEVTPARVAMLAPSVAAAEKPNDAADWSRVSRLDAGTEILLTVRDRDPRKVKVGLADDSSLTVILPVDPPLPRDVERTLITLGPKWPNILEGYPTMVDTLRVSREGVFKDGKKLADLTQIVQRVDRAAVVEIRRFKSHATRGALWGTLAGLSLGIVMGASYNDLEGSSRGGAVFAGGVAGALVGLAVGAGVGAAIPANPVVYATPK